MQIRLSILALCAGSLFLGIWHGEDLCDPFVVVLDLGGGAIWLAALLLVAWRKPAFRKQAIACAIVVPAVMAVGLFVGDRVGRRAWNECVLEGELVRTALSEFYRETGGYPEELPSLGLRRIPGGRFLRGGILDYDSTGEGYSLRYGDWLVSFVATESTPFTGFK